MALGTSQKTIRLDVELPDIGEMIANIIEDSEKRLIDSLPDGCFDGKESAENYTRFWLDMMFERGKRIKIKREYNLAQLSLKNGK